MTFKPSSHPFSWPAFYSPSKIWTPDFCFKSKQHCFNLPSIHTNSNPKSSNNSGVPTNQMFQLWAGGPSNQVGGISKDGGKWKCNDTIGLPDSDWQTADGWLSRHWGSWQSTEEGRDFRCSNFWWWEHQEEKIKNIKHKRQQKCQCLKWEIQ